MVSSTFHQIKNNFSHWNVLYAVLFEKQYIKSRTFNDKNRWIIKKVVVFKKLLPHLATRGTYSPGDWRCDEAWRDQTLVYPPVMCQQRLIYCTWELNVMYDKRVFVLKEDGFHLPGSQRQWIIENGDIYLYIRQTNSAWRGWTHELITWMILPVWVNLRSTGW